MINDIMGTTLQITTATTRTQPESNHVGEKKVHYSFTFNEKLKQLTLTHNTCTEPKFIVQNFFVFQWIGQFEHGFLQHKETVIFCSKIDLFTPKLSEDIL